VDLFTRQHSLHISGLYLYMYRLATAPAPWLNEVHLEQRIVEASISRLAWA
jgi:hypothetical protein